MRYYILAFLFSVLLALSARPAYACAYSIPVVGRWSTLQIGLDIPPTPTWARGLILDAARAWNLAQVWYQQNYFPDGSVYTFVASASGNVTISFSMPTEFAPIAVGWTQYRLDGAAGMWPSILSAHVFLDGSVFNAPEEPNTTSQEYGFRLALHELGRVLGLGSLLDGLDVMDPVGTISRAGTAPIISLIDLFALHILASEPNSPLPVITLNTNQQVLLNAWNLVGFSPDEQNRTASGNSTTLCPVRTAKRCFS